MKTKKRNKVALNDQNLTGRKAKHVKGGPIYMKYDLIPGYDLRASNTFAKIDVAQPTGQSFLKQ